jgi:hypothetical protein
MWSFSRAYPTPATDERQVTTTIAVTPITDGARLLGRGWNSVVTVVMATLYRNPLAASRGPQTRVEPHMR